MSMLRIGTCSWKYDSWRGIVYSENPKINYLKEYAEKFDTVEIDQWFWSLHGLKKVTLPNPSVVNAYKLSVPKDFKFTVKIPNSITLTHFYKKSKGISLQTNPYFLSNDLFEQFLYAIDPLKNNMGVLMFQFEYLNKEKMKSQMEFQERFSDFISNCPKDFKYGVEIRNPNYINTDYFKFLSDNKLTPVFLQGYYMPDIFDLFNKFGEMIEDQVVIRLHGPDRKGIEQRSKGEWSKIIEPKDNDISKLIRVLNTLSLNDMDIYVNVNNHFEGSAPLTIQKMKTLL